MQQFVHVFFIVKFFGNQNMHQAIEEGHVGAHLDGDMDIGEFGQLGVPRISHNQVSALLDSILQEGGSHRMRLRHVGADDEEGLGLGKISKRIGHRPRTKSSRQTGDGGSVSGTGAVIDIIRLDHGAEKLLHVIGVFVNTPGAAHASQSVGTVLGNGLFNFARHQVQGFVPGGLPEVAPFLVPDQGQWSNVPESK